MKQAMLLPTVIAITLCWLPQIGSSETYYVSLDGLDNRTGTGDWTNAVRTISNAISKATSAGDLVLVSKGTYVLDAELRITNDVTVMSQSGPEQTIISGNYPTRTTRSVNVNSLQALLTGFTISNSMASGGSSTITFGGGVRIDRGTVSNCIIRNCSSVRGGGGAAVYGTNSFLIASMLFNNYAQDSGSAGGGGGFYAATGNVYSCIISNCVSPRGGGGFLVGKCIVQTCLINSNRASSGGGLWNDTGASEINTCTINSNYATYQAGGLYLVADRNALISNCVITANSVNRTALTHSGYGGGLYVLGGNRIIESTIQGNTAGDQGGGARSGSDIWERCLIQNNFAGNVGGGLYIAASLGIDLKSCLIASNAATTNGGGIYIALSETAIRNCTIVANTASNLGGGVYISRGLTGTYTNLMVNTILYFNTAAASSNWYTSNPNINYVAYTNCCMAPAPAANYGSGNTAADPAMASVNEGNYRLTKESPCVNTGFHENWMLNALDLDGRPHLDRFCGLADMGCYEFVWSGSLIKLR